MVIIITVYVRLVDLEVRYWQLFAQNFETVDLVDSENGFSPDHALHKLPIVEGDFDVTVLWKKN